MKEEVKCQLNDCENKATTERYTKDGSLIDVCESCDNEYKDNEELPINIEEELRRQITILETVIENTIKVLEDYDDIGHDEIMELIRQLKTVV